MRNFARNISKIFHPIFLPLIAFLLTLVATEIYINYSAFQLFIIIGIIVLLTIIFPIIVILFLKWVGLISQLELNDKSERIAPLMLSVIFIWGCSEILYRFNFPITLILFFRYASIIIVIATFITLFWKISMHALGWGILSAIALILFGFRDTPYFFLFPVIILISGLVSSARLYLNAHTQTQIYCGFSLGFFGMLIGLFFQSIIINHIL